MATIKSVLSQLENTPPPAPQKSPQYRAVEEAYELIKQHLKQGWTFRAICQHLNEQKVEISETTLRKHYTAIDKAARKAKRQARQNAKANAPATSPAHAPATPPDYTAADAIEIPPPLVPTEVVADP